MSVWRGSLSNQYRKIGKIVDGEQLYQSADLLPPTVFII